MFRSYLSYLRCPKYIKSGKFNIKDFFCLFLACLIGNGILVMLASIVVHFLDLKHVGRNLEVKFLFFHSILWIPIVEETFFRILLKPNKKNFFIYFFIMTIAIFLMIWNEKYIIACVAIVIILSMLLVRINVKLKVLKSFIQNFPIFFYLSFIIFGLLHLVNYKFPSFNIGTIAFSLIVVLPQIYAGSILGFIRMKYGIIFSMLFHALNNIIPFIFMYGDFI